MYGRSLASTAWLFGAYSEETGLALTGDKMKRNARLSKHHRKCVSNGGGSDAGNIFWCNRKRHEAWHLLFQNWEIHEIVREINRWIDPAFVVMVQRKYDCTEE